MDCNKCEGKLYYLIPNYQHDTLERIECIDCISEMQYQDDIKERLTKLLVTASPQRLAQIVAEVAVNGIIKDVNSNLTRYETIIATKNLSQALMLANIYAEE
mgnify:FL=1|tara:strand:- start:1324 stop:1629 length:306 start_codon:yes stop_codon:yes gene_type:complete